jgi:hypothetical protein
LRKNSDGSAKKPNKAELNSIAGDPDKVREIRSRLSDISWWMRLLNQRIAQRANCEDNATGRFWEARYKSVRLIDEETILACSAYVDLNPIRAGLAPTLEASDHTSVQRRIQSLNDVDSGVKATSAQASKPTPTRRDACLSPVEIDELRDELGARRSNDAQRCSDKGFLSMSVAAYVELLDWTARQVVPGKSGSTPESTPAIFERLKIKPAVWKQLVTQFGVMFSAVAGQPHRVDEHRGTRGQSYYLRATTRHLLAS